MQQYHKINSVFKRDTSKKGNPMIMWDWSEPEYELLKDHEWVFTEKIDGTNIRVMWDGNTETVKFGGKTDNAQIPTKLLEHLIATFTVEKLYDVFGDMQVCLYGEGYGKGIQKAGVLYSDEQKFVLFDVKIGSVYLETHNIVDVAFKLGIQIVPIVEDCTLTEAIELIQEGYYSSFYDIGEKSGNFLAEGLVGVPKGNFYTRLGRRIITKIKTKDLYKG